VRYFRSCLFDIGLVLAVLGLALAYLTIQSMIPLWLGEAGIGAFSLNAFLLAALVVLIGLTTIIIGVVRVRQADAR
jgi:hypothetical protein